MPAAAAISLSMAVRPIEAITRKSDTATTIERLPWRGSVPSRLVFIRRFVGAAEPAIRAACLMRKDILTLPETHECRNCLAGLTLKSLRLLKFAKHVEK